MATIVFLLFCMGSIGLTAILVDGKIFLPLRLWLEQKASDAEERRETLAAKNRQLSRTWPEFFREIITCYQCCGFWSGLFCGLFLLGAIQVGAIQEFPVFQKNELVSNVFLPGVCHSLFFCVYGVFFLLMCGLAGSFLNTVYLMFVELIFAKTMLCRRTNPEPPHHHNHHEEGHDHHDHHEEGHGEE